MSSSPQKKTSQKPIKKTGGMFSQLLEFFGMTPTVPSEYLTRVEFNEVGKQIIHRCKACHNPAKWIEKEERWRCSHHPQAEIVKDL